MTQRTAPPPPAPTPTAPPPTGARPPLLPLVARQLCYVAGDRTLIDAVSLTLTHGPRTVILGPNGAGKSLLLRLLHGLLAPTSGAVQWAGAAADGPISRRQAMVFQRPVLLRRSVQGNLHHALAARSIPGAERRPRIAAALADAGLTDLADRPARRLSGGEQQRLAMARALALEPEILFLDEPTASLDPASTLAIERLIEQAHGRGCKIVLVTHDLGQARRLADDVVFLARGRVVERTDAAAFFDRPTSAEARAYLDGRLVL